jgi:hypothetical protein
MPKMQRKLRGLDTAISSYMLDQALTAIRRDKKVDRKHDVPYLAGYSKDGRTIYIDRRLPKSFRTKKGRRVQVDRYLVLHEAMEKTLIDELGLHYQHAHQIAARAEQSAVRADGIPWGEYDAFNQRYIRLVAEGEWPRSPSDLDLTPYQDEQDRATLKILARTAKKRKTRKEKGSKARQTRIANAGGKTTKVAKSSARATV